MEQDLSIFAEHWPDFARLSMAEICMTTHHQYPYGKALSPVFAHKGGFKSLDELMNKHESFYVYDLPIAIISPDGINAHIYSASSDIHIITTISELKTTLCDVLGKDVDKDYEFVDGTPTESIRNCLERIRDHADRKPEFRELFIEYYDKCRGYLPPIMMKSAAKLV